MNVFNRINGKTLLSGENVRVVRQTENEGMPRLYLIIMVIWGMLSSVLCFLSSFANIRLNVWIICGVVALVSVTASLALSIKKIEGILTTLMLVICGAFGVVFFRELREQLLVLYNNVAQDINDAYNISLYQFDMSKGMYRYTDVTMAVSWLFSVLAILAAFFTSVKFSVIGTAIVTFPAAALGFIFTLMPANMPFIAYVGFLAATLQRAFLRCDASDGRKSGKFVRKGRKICLANGRNFGCEIMQATLITGITVVLLGCLALVIIPSDQYRRPEFIEEARINIKTYMNSFENILWGNTASGGVSDGELGRVNSIEYANVVDIEAELPKTGSNIYLRAYIGSEYTGDSFEPLSNDVYDEYEDTFEFFQENNFNSLTMTGDLLAMLDDNKVFRNSQDDDGIMNCDISISLKGASRKYDYLPYYTTYINSQDKGTEDGGLKNSSSNMDVNMYYFAEDATYRVASTSSMIEKHYSDYGFFSYSESRNVISDSLEQYYECEALYRTFAHDVYTRLPEDFNQDIIERMDEYVIVNNEDVFQLISDIQKEFSRNYEYTLSPGALPVGEDFVEYFLTESKQGYCTYFAASSVVLLRAAGVPARYVSGYVINDADINGQPVSKSNGVDLYSVSIEDSSAHAWVEVYIDGFGWLTVDFSPGHQNTISQSLENENSTYEPEEEETTQEETTAGEVESQTQETVEDEEIQQVNRETEEETVPVFHREETDYAGILLRFLIFILCIVACPLIIFMIIWCVHKVIRFMYHRKMRKADGETFMKLSYARMEKLLAVINIRKDDSMNYTDFAEYADKECYLMSKGKIKEFMNIIQKARFGGIEITREERLNIKKVLRTLEDGIYKVLHDRISKRKAFIFRYIRNLHD